jgi:hypothetical protein
VLRAAWDVNDRGGVRAETLAEIDEKGCASGIFFLQ